MCVQLKLFSFLYISNQYAVIVPLAYANLLVLYIKQTEGHFEQLWFGHCDHGWPLLNILYRLACQPPE
jgi:hypothetical protein